MWLCRMVWPATRYEAKAPAAGRRRLTVYGVATRPSPPSLKSFLQISPAAATLRLALPPTARGSEDGMPDRLKGKRVLVTDAEEFMGPDVIELFREEGAEVIATTRDLRDTAACRALITEVGQVDVLMANLAGGTDRYAITETPDDELDRLHARMVRPLDALTRAVLPQMMARRRGKIVVIGSATGMRGQPSRAAYSAARGAQHAYVRSVGIEVAPHGINMVATGQTFVENPSYFPPEYQATEEFQARLKGLPAGRLSTGREAAMFLLALAGPESDWMFGQVFAYAGGWVV